MPTMTAITARTGANCAQAFALATGSTGAARAVVRSSVVLTVELR